MIPEHEQDKRDIIASVANDYYDSLKNEAPFINMKFEELGAFCRGLAKKDVDRLLVAARIDELHHIGTRGNWLVTDNKAITITARIAELEAEDSGV